MHERGFVSEKKKQKIQEIEIVVLVVFRKDVIYVTIQWSNINGNRRYGVVW